MLKIDWTEAIYYEKDYLWFIPCDYPVLFLYNCRDNKTVKSIDLPNYYSGKKRAFSKIIKMENNLYLVPTLGSKLLEYNIDQDVIVEWDFSEFIDNETCAFYGAYASNKIIYLFSPLIGIYGFDVDKKRFFSCDWIEQKIRPNFSCCEGEIIASCVDDNTIIQLDSELSVKHIYTVGNTNNKYTSPIEYDGQIYAMTFGESKNSIIRYNKSNRQVYTYSIDGLSAYCSNYIGSLIINNEIIFLPSNCGKDIVSIDLLNYSVKIKTISEEDKYAFSTYRYNDDTGYGYDIYSSRLYIFKNDGIIWHSIVADDAYTNKINEIRLSKRSELLFEEKKGDLEYYINKVI